MKRLIVEEYDFFGRAPSWPAHQPMAYSGSRYSLQAPQSATTFTHSVLGLFASIAHAAPSTRFIGSYLILFSVLVSSCSVQPEPLQYGKDICHLCKMTLVDKKYGAELVTTKGKIYRFDDINCMLNFYNSNYETPEEFKYKLVVDFANPGQLIDASSALYLKSSELRTPMGSEVAAFESKSNLDAHKKKIKGIFMAWGEVITQYK
ncbi:MAG: nitrous oxide reductase accessory protein NosL [Cyclobacteriaceae bacterium]|nr:nitrous oxide reductase accessory protein NosL [Flammeovirgaceae bacterium]